MKNMSLYMGPKSLALRAVKSFLCGQNRTLLCKTRRAPTHSFVSNVQQVYEFKFFKSINTTVIFCAPTKTMSYLRSYGTPAQRSADRNARGEYGWRELKALEQANKDAVARAMTLTSNFRQAEVEREDSSRKRLRMEITEFMGLSSKSSEELERLRNHLKLVLGDGSGHMLTF